MATLEQRNFGDPHETRPFRANGHVDVITLGGFSVGRGVFEPGWKWSVDVKPIAGTDSCQARHTGIVQSGSMLVRSDDGTEVTYAAGDAFVMEPGHDAWTVGDEACVLYDTAITGYATPA
jgi:hypothetical protein